MSQTDSTAATTKAGTKAAAILRAHDLHRTFRMGDSLVEVLRGVDFTVRHGEFVAIEGRSGSGKSTLLHILAALDGIDSGSLTFDGKDYTTISEKPGRYRDILQPKSFYHWVGTVQSIGGRWLIRGLLALLLSLAVGLITWLFVGLGAAIGLKILTYIGWSFATISGAILAFAALAVGIPLVPWIICASIYAVLFYQRERPKSELRNQQFGFVFQFYHLLPELSVLENTLLAPMIERSWLRFRAGRSAIRQQAVTVLTQLGLGHRLKHRPNQLSGGERQRVAIARALMNNPRVLFADEPTGNLDVETGRQIMNLLEKLHRDSGQTIVMVTHDRALAREADRVLVLKDGKLEKAE